MIENKKGIYMPWLDVAKGIGIILVVIGHAMFPKHLVIDGFHMALFFMLSGVTFSTRDTFINFTKKKFLRILLPCIFWATVWILTGIPNIPIWFLYTIFFGFIFLYFTIKSFSLWISAILVLSMSLLLCGEHSLLLVNRQITRIIIGAIFMYIGYILNYIITIEHSVFFQFLDKNRRVISNKFVVAIEAIIITIIYLLVVLGGEKQGYYKDLSFGQMTLFQINWGLMMLITLSGSLATVLFAILLQNSRILHWFGKNSLVIMCVHFPLAEKLNHLISTMPHFNSIIYKLGYGIIEYIILFSFSALMVLFCNRFLPTLTGGLKYRQSKKILN